MNRISLTSFIALVCMCGISRAQVVFPPAQQSVGGVYISTDGIVQHRTTESKSDLETARLRAKAMNQPAKGHAVAYVSLNRLMAQVKTLTEQNKPLPDELKYLSGMTSIQYVFVFEEEKDLVIAGPAEAIDASNPMQATGKTTGRPVLQLDDLITALRMNTESRRKSQAFGCSIDPAPDAIEKSNQVMREFALATRGERMNAMKEALGPQRVSMFGAPADTRFAFVTLAADYKLKRMCLGVDAIPVPGVGSAMDSSRAASARFWFEANYAPLLVSAAGDAYEFRGQRLMLKAGALTFDDRGATDTAKLFAKNFTAKLPQLATMVPAFADLQNVADLALLASLIRHDKLDQKTGLDLSWVMNNANLNVAKLPTPKHAQTLVNFTNGSIVAGGVTLNLGPVLEASAREEDKKESFKSSRTRPTGENWRSSSEVTKN